MKTDKIEGEWWLKQDSSKRIKGELILEESQITLELVDCFTPINEYFPSNQDIYGLSNNGKVYSLLSCHESFRSENKSVLTALLAIHGLHTTLEDRYWSAVGIYPDLLSWLKVFPLKFENHFDNHTAQFDSSHEPLRFPSTKDGIKRRIDIGCHYDFKGGIKVEMEAYGELVIESTDGLNIKEFIGELLWFKTLLSILKFSQTPLTRILIKLSNDEKARFHEVHFKKTNNELELDKSSLGFLLDYQSIKPNFNEFIANYYNLRNEFTVIVKLLEEEINNRNSFNENNFLNTIRSIEVFHRRFRSKNEIPESHRKKISSIINSVEDDLQRWLEQKLTYSHEPSLRKRLKEVLGEIESRIFNDIIKKKSDFVNNVVNSRNYYTHYDISSKQNAKSGAALLELNIILRFVLFTIVLKDLGLNLEDIDAALYKRRYNFLWRFYGT